MNIVATAMLFYVHWVISFSGKNCGINWNFNEMTSRI